MARENERERTRLLGELFKALVISGYGTMLLSVVLAIIAIVGVLRDPAVHSKLWATCLMLILVLNLCFVVARKLGEWEEALRPHLTPAANHVTFGDLRFVVVQHPDGKLDVSEESMQVQKESMQVQNESMQVQKDSIKVQ